MSEHVCSIRRAGVLADGSAQLDLKSDTPLQDGGFDWNWFVSTPTIGKQVLAVALTALATGLKMDCVVTDPVAPSSRVETAFLVT
jgi:hypothetical protein